MLSLTDIIPQKKKAIFFAKRQLSEFVYDAVNLEGIHFTLPEVQTLLDGVTVGGHRLSDQSIVLNQSFAWRRLFALLENQEFALDKKIACELHGIAAKDEALVAGEFRTGGVTIAGTDYCPPESKKLDGLWDDMLEQAEAISDFFDKAIFVFLQMSRNQFFYDVNKRMGRFMMNGILLSAGYPAINLPAKRQMEFNTLMLEFYPTGDIQPMLAFMKSCLSDDMIRLMAEPAE